MLNSTLVITADHNHFPVSSTRGTCPLIIASPAITKKIEIETAYQMDIFPTLLHAINQNYFWHGLGIDLLDLPTSAPLPTTHNPSAHYSSPRSITPHEASVLSDKLIRTNYFSTHTH
jgi:phosphoglycerol transferase MdoB-like AlkP superfamily enzyme